MTIQRMEHVGIVVDDLAAATAFFGELGLKLRAPSARRRGASSRAAGLLVGVTDRLTLDTNLLQEYWREQAKQDVVQRLLDFAKTEAAELVVTARIADDIPSGPLAKRLRELPELGIAQIGGIFRLDHSALDGPDMLGSDIFIELQKRADAELLRRGRASVPDWRDWDHVHAHFVKNRDVFLTWDKRLVEGVGIVAEQLPIKATTPENYLTARQIAADVIGQLDATDLPH